MTEEKQKEYYGAINSIWKHAKTGDTGALLGIDLAGFIFRHLNRTDMSDTAWQAFSKELQEIADRYQAPRCRIMIDTVAHSLMQTLIKTNMEETA